MAKKTEETPATPPAPDPEPAGGESEIEALKKQLAALEKKAADMARGAGEEISRVSEATMSNLSEKIAELAAKIDELKGTKVDAPPAPNTPSKKWWEVF